MTARKVSGSELPYAIYARQSHDRDGEGLAVDRQIKECRELARKLGLSGKGVVYSDNDVSATSGKPRPAYERLMEALRSGRHSRVLAWHSDRIYRKNTDLEPLIALIETTGVRLYTVQSSGDGEVDLTTPDGRMVARILGAVATREVEHKGQRQRSANRDRALLGRRSTGGPRPFGYGQTITTTTINEEGEAITKRTHFNLNEINEPEAAAIREAFERKLRGESDWAIFTDWNRRGIRTQRGNEWNGIAFRHMLRRPALAGLVDYKGEVLPGVTAAWPAIVSEDVWRAVVAGIMRDPERRAQSGPPVRHLLGGLVHCECSQPLMSAVLAAKNGGRGIYKCQSIRTGSREGSRTGHVSINREILDAYAKARVVDALIRRRELLSTKVAPDNVHLAKLNGDLTSARAAEKRLASAIASDIISLDAAREDSKRIKSEIQRLRTEIDEATRSATETFMLDDTIAAMFMAAADKPVWGPRHKDGTRKVNLGGSLIQSMERDGLSRSEAVRRAVDHYWSGDTGSDEFRAELLRRFETLPLDERRAMIRSLVKITVLHGVRGAGRMTCDYVEP